MLYFAFYLLRLPRRTSPRKRNEEFLNKKSGRLFCLPIFVVFSASAEVGFVVKDNARLVEAFKLEHYKLVFALFEERGGQIGGALRADLPISRERTAVNEYHSFFKAGGA